MSDTVELVGLSKRFGEVTAVDRVTLTVAQGELLTLLGPSGCGKTTLLRLISGFERPTEGSIHVGGIDVTGLPPHLRDINQVFQSYALFPHLTVAENIGFGLKMKRLAQAEIALRVAEVVELVSLRGLEARYVHELSGGQRQRVAVARAIVPQPRVLLLDEPLSALDAKLRREMQVELRRLQQTVGLTTILVTHDQEEALAMSDRVAVMNSGRIEQLGTGEEVYGHPKTPFVAGFLGESNLLLGVVLQAAEGSCLLGIQEGWQLWSRQGPGARALEGERRTLSIRPDKLRVGLATASGSNAVRGRVTERTFLGSRLRVAVKTNSGQELTAIVGIGPESEAVQKGAEVVCTCDPGDVVLLDLQ